MNPNDHELKTPGHFVGVISAYQMRNTDYRTLLGFTDAWFAMGVMTEEGLQRYGADYETSSDKNTEHYCYGAFHRYLSTHRPLSESIAEGLYALGESDTDRMMGWAIMADIIRLPECPESVSSKALASGDRRLIRIANRRRLLVELGQSSLTADLFRACLDSMDSTVHRDLLERSDLSTEQVQSLAEHGAGRAVRNMASDRLRSKQSRTVIDNQRQ